MFKNEKKGHDDGLLWGMFVVIAISISFLVTMEILREKSDVFSLKSSNMTASSQSTKALDVSVMIVPAD
jgi:hypothetical protein